MQYNLILTYCICNNLISKWAHVQRYWGWDFRLWILEGRYCLTPNIHMYICLYWYMYMSQCSVIGYWEFLRSVEIGHGVGGWGPCVRNGINFLLDISGKHSGKWSCSEPMHGKSCARAHSFRCLFSKILLAMLGSFQMRTTSGGWACVYMTVCRFVLNQLQLETVA